MAVWVYLGMNTCPESTPDLLALVRAKAAACADKAALAATAGAEWQRQAREWAAFAAELQDHDELAPLVSVAPRART